METTTAVALILAVVSTTLVNLAYLREHEAVTALPALRMRRPVESARVLLANRRWLLGFAMETTGFLLYAAALALGASAAIALVVLSLAQGLVGAAVANAIAGGLFFSIGDVSTELATQGGARIGFAITLILGYVVGTALLQAGYQAGTALSVAGIATLLTNAVPIAAGTIVLNEPVPAGALGGLRIAAFVLVSVGAFLLGRPDRPRPRVTPEEAAHRTTPGDPQLCPAQEPR